MKEPRTTLRGNLKHLLTDMIFLVIAAVISGADEWTKIELFGKSQLPWLRKYVPLANGIPSHDTLGRVFGMLDHNELSHAFSQWTNQLADLTNDEVIAIDGKTMKGSRNREHGLKAIHMVSAFASANGICLGQVACEQKSNEITAIPELLKLIAIKGCTITIDAIGCQAKIAKQIRKGEADYILAVKENQEELHLQVQKVFEITPVDSSDEDVDKGHGRVETRKCSIINDLAFLDGKEKWVDLSSIIKIESERFIQSKNKLEKETRYYISSLKENAKTINKKIRSHWSVENNLHWMLDVNFNEDKSRKRIQNSAKNFNVFSKIALTLITNEKSTKVSNKGKIYYAGIDPAYREKVLKI